MFLVEYPESVLDDAKALPNMSKQEDYYDRKSLTYSFNVEEIYKAVKSGQLQSGNNYPLQNVKTRTTECDTYDKCNSVDYRSTPSIITH
jgi:hypothetical protein